MKSKIKKLISSSFMKNFFILSFSTLLVQVINLVASPIITRLFDSDQLGAYTLAISIISIMGPVICARFDLSIVMAKNDDEVAHLIILSIVFTLMLTAITSIWFIFYLKNNPVIFDNLGYLVILVVILLLIVGLSNILISYNNRNKEYKLISKVTLIRGSSQSIGQVIFGIFKLGSKGLLLAYFIGSCLGLKKQAESLLKNIAIFKNITSKKLKSTFIKYKKQLIYGTPSNFINGLSYSILNFLITDLYGLSVFGYYSLSYRMLGIPLTLISTNMSKIFFQEASQEKNTTNSFSKSFSKNSRLLVVISSLVTALLMVASPYVFPIIFGSDWYTAGIYVVILAPMFGARLIVSTLSPGLIISNRQNVELYFQFAFILMALISYAVCSFFSLSIVAFLILVSFTYSFVYILLFFYINKVSKLGGY